MDQNLTVALRVFKWVQLVAALLAIGYGLSTRTPTDRMLLPLGLAFSAGAILYFPRGMVPDVILIALASAVMIGAFALQVRIHRQRRAARAGRAT